MLQERSRSSFPPTFALAYTGLDEKDQAFARLEQSLTNRESIPVFLNVDAIWDSLRSDPRFDDLVRRMGLPQ
jgi:hypothetical protein